MTVVANLVNEFNRWQSGDVASGERVCRRLLLYAVDYASRHPKRHLDNPFLTRARSVKAMLDTSPTLFEYLYFGLADQGRLASIINCSGELIGREIHLPVYPINSPRTVVEGGVLRASLPSDIDIRQLHQIHQQCLLENEQYLSQHPQTRWQVDQDAGRIWTQNYESEARRRGYWLNASNAPPRVQSLMSHPHLIQAASDFSGTVVECESLLCEELTPTELKADRRDWHIDKLADQVKIFITLEDISERHGALRWFKDTLPENLMVAGLPRPHLHHSFIYSGMTTSNVNFIPSSSVVISDKQECCAVQNTSEMLLLDTRVIHSGSPCLPDHVRRTITLTYRVRSWRNEALCSLPNLYG
ncbi:hypothetical protein [Niveibacterium sp.]|uniref:hypothetical protein n=1 Tax=Niveibacterium sp. TaxID=2017444 RepID=UPI0035AF6F10